MTEPLLVLDELTKTFRRPRAKELSPEDRVLHAVTSLSLTVRRGDVFGFLGPNGAGKSTTLRMALGLIHPTSGRVTIGGHALATDRLRALRKVGAFVEAPAFYGYLSGRKNLEIFAALSGPTPAKSVEEVLARVGLLGRENDPVRVYSHGMRTRLGLASCLLPRPELLVLDEPTDGLDPHGVHEVRELILRLAREEGLTVFLSSHRLGEVEDLCNRIAVLDRGRLVLEGALAELAARHRRLRIETDRPEEAAGFLNRRFGLSPSLPEPAAGSRSSLSSFLVACDGHPAEELNAALLQAGFAVRELAPETHWLDRLFLERTTTSESNLHLSAIIHHGEHRAHREQNL